MKTRVLAALAVLVSGYVHLKLWADGYKELHVVGPAFMVNAVAAVVIAVLLVTWRHWIPPLLAAGFGVATLVPFLISTTSSGFYGAHERWSGPYIWSAFISEVVAVIAGSWTFWHEGGLSALRPQHHGSRGAARI